MNPPGAHTATFKARTAMGVSMVSVIVGALVGAVLCMQIGWAEGRVLTNAAGLAGIVWIVGALVGVQVLVIGTGLSVDRLGMGVLASSMARMMGALFAGLMVFFMLHPDGRTFWVTFLSAGLVALVAEALWAVRVINSSPASGRPAQPAKHGAV